MENKNRDLQGKGENCDVQIVQMCLVVLWYIIHGIGKAPVSMRHVNIGKNMIFNIN